MKLLATHLLAIGLTVVAARGAFAGVPDPSHSSCPASVTIAPDGSCCFDVIVRDAANNPVAGSNVVVNFGSCAVVFCPAQPPNVQIVGNGVRVLTDASGRAHICVCASFTPPCTASITADGVFLCNEPMSSSCGPTPTSPHSWGSVRIIYR